ncbi:MAG: di-trans,poly-cis-decaprenylcistransferase [Planctomycetes bacterium]|nr:di-trans,poly-cis-decaprenylcistransferase [Planctomycetota bacterium]
MDGNGRWAERRGKRRIEGHRRGGDALDRTIEASIDRGIREVTFYALSTENFRSRPRTEVSALMRLLREHLVRQRSRLARDGIRFRAIGRLDALPSAVRREIAETESATSGGTRLVARLALNYGGRQEILDAAAACARGGEAAPDEATFRQYLYDSEMSDPDLLIRTGGDFRISNFLLWQVSYAEIYVTETLWPDFDAEALDAALASYARRERRFGTVGARRRGRGMR